MLRSTGLLLLCIALLAAGDNDSHASADAFKPVVSADARAPEPGQHWLDNDSGLLPERWPVTQITDAPVAADDAQVQQIGQHFDRLDPLFAESRRMLANRSLQLHRALTEAGIDEPMDATLEVFAQARADHIVGNFSQYSAYYTTLRQQGVSRLDVGHRL